MKRLLSWQALSMMDGNFVVVHDDEYDAYDQTCEVRVHKIFKKNPINGKMVEIVDEILFENDEFTYRYSMISGCVNGAFRVFSCD